MFGGDDAEPSAAPTPAAPAAAAPDAKLHDLVLSWTIPQLKGFLERRGLADTARAAVEKNELVSAVRAEVSNAGLSAPPDFAWKAELGLFASASMVFDVATTLFRSREGGGWFRWDDAAGSFVGV
jgi:hypothetical protein